LDRADDLERPLVPPAAVGRRGGPRVEDQGGFGDGSRAAGPVAEEPREPREHRRQLTGVGAVAVVDVVAPGPRAGGGAEPGGTDRAKGVAPLVVRAPSRPAPARMEGIQEWVAVRAVVADRSAVDRLAFADGREPVVPERGRRLGGDRTPGIPEAWRGPGRCRGRWQISPEDSRGEPVPPRVLAARAEGPVEGGHRPVRTGGQSLAAFRARAVEELDEWGAGGCRPEGLGQSPLDDRGTERRRSTPVDGGDDVFPLDPKQA